MEKWMLRRSSKMDLQRQEVQTFQLKLQGMKRSRTIQFYNIYQILYGWFQKCSTANIYLEGPMLKE